MANKYLDYDGLLYFWQKIKTLFVKSTDVDSAMSASSTHPVQNSVIKAYVDSAISGVTQFDYQVVSSLPATGTKGVIYLVSHGGSGTDIYDEYIWITSSSSYEKIGSTSVDLSGYVSNVAYDSTNKKLTQTKGGSTTTDIVTVATIKTALNLAKGDVGLGNVDNTADANKSVLSASKLTTARNIDGMSFDGQASITHITRCTTGASTKAKAVNLTGFTVEGGARIIVLFQNGNTHTSPTLNVNSTGAKPIYGYDVVSGTGASLSLASIKADQAVEMVYDTQSGPSYGWRVIGFAPAEMISSDISTGTSTDHMTVSPKLLVDSFASVAITNSEIDTVVAS